MLGSQPEVSHFRHSRAASSPSTTIASPISHVDVGARGAHMTVPRKQSDAMTRRYGRQLTNRKIAEAVRDRIPPLRLRTTRLTQHALHATREHDHPRTHGDRKDPRPGRLGTRRITTAGATPRSRACPRSQSISADPSTADRTSPTTRWKQRRGTSTKVPRTRTRSTLRHTRPGLGRRCSR